MLPRFRANTGELFDLEDESDLRQDYQNAVDCLIQCETLFNSFQDQLRSKNHRIDMLEDKVMELSLELAAIKARQDVPNLKKNEIEGAHNSSQQKRLSCNTTSCSDRRISWTSWVSDNSGQNANKLPNFGHLINKSLHWLEAKRTNNDGAVQVEFPNDENDPMSGGGDSDPTGTKMLRRHTTNLKKRSSGSLHLERSLRRSRSSASSGMTGLTLEGVIFPVSSFEVYSKGCRVDNKAKTDMRNSDWPELR